jgi:hypothetical protein
MSSRWVGGGFVGEFVEWFVGGFDGGFVCGFDGGFDGCTGVWIYV